MQILLRQIDPVPLPDASLSVAAYTCTGSKPRAILSNSIRERDTSFRGRPLVLRRSFMVRGRVRGFGCERRRRWRRWRHALPVLDC